jgi:hypothetical protein
VLGVDEGPRRVRDQEDEERDGEPGVTF